MEVLDERANHRARCSELELEVARNRDEMSRLKDQNRSFANKIHSLTTAATAAQGGGGVTEGGSAMSTEEKYQLQKQLVNLTESKDASEAQVTRLKQNIATMELNLNREIQKARDESERQAVFLRSQLLESKEMQGVLQEKLVVQAGVAETLRHSEMESYTTENILITSDAVLHRITAEKPLSSYKSKYDVVASISGRTLVLSGKKLNVHLLKAEILEALNEMYATMTDPTKYVSSAKARDSARHAELDHLRRTISTYESTVQSLHTALQHAQDKAHSQENDKQKHEHEMLLFMERMKGEESRRGIQVQQLQQQVAAQQTALSEAESTNTMALESLKAEARVTAEFRSENSLLKEAVQQAVDGKELAERAAYSAKEQSRATSFSYQEMIRQGNSVEAERRRAEMLDQRCSALQEEIEHLRKASSHTLEATATEKGKTSEQMSVQINEIHTLREEVKELTVALQQSKVELQASHVLCSEMRDRMNSGALLGATSMMASHKHSSETGEGAKNRLKALEAENLNLRKELQQAFDDLRAVAGAVKDGKTMRERALSEIQALELERSRMVEERQTLEVELVRERMAGNSKIAEMNMKVAQAQEEAAHGKERAEMLHKEYQGRIQEVLNGSAKVGQLMTGEYTPNDASKLPSPTPNQPHRSSSPSYGTSALSSGLGTSHNHNHSHHPPASAASRKTGGPTRLAGIGSSHGLAPDS